MHDECMQVGILVAAYRRGAMLLVTCDGVKQEFEWYMQAS